MATDSEAIAVAVASIIAIVLLTLYAFASRRERGQNPHWSAEVYLYYDPSVPSPDIPKLTAAYSATVATPEQIEVYLVAGGGAHGYGYASANTIVGAVPTGVGLGGLTIAVWPGAAPPSPVGVWLYGAKPRRGARGVVPFSCAYWFQPA